jgi:protein-disulfide isomerase
MNIRDARELFFRLAAGLGLGVSLALLWEYTRAAGPAFCAPGGGCDVVRQSAYAELGGIPTPLFGVLFFGAALVLSALRGARARNLLAVWSAGGAAVSAALLLIQGVAIGAFCTACVTADAAALVMLPLALLGRRDADYPRPRLHLATAAALLLAAIPFGYGVVQPSEAATQPPEQARVDELPAPVAEMQVEGKVTIVEFLDFTCPFCRRFHHDLEEILPDYGDEVAVVRVYLANPRSDVSQLAALAAICAEERGLGDEMTDALFEPAQLGPQTVVSQALSLGFTQEELASCMTSEETMKRVEEAFAAAEAVELEGLPTVYIGSERYQGAQPPETIRASIDRELARGDASR